MLYILEVAYCPVFCEKQLLNSCCSSRQFHHSSNRGGVTPIDSVITAATVLVNPYTKEGVESQCIPYTSVNVCIVNSQRLKFNAVNGQSPENQQGQQSKR